MSDHFIIKPVKDKSLRDLEAIVDSAQNLILSDESKRKILNCRTFLEEEILSSKKTVYGINTGFGSLCNKIISEEHLEELQVNLVRSHACGTGDIISPEISKRMLLHKIISLSYGNSGTTLDLVEFLVAMYNRDVIPVVYEMGSLGASGDLAPLAHLAMAVIGEGEVHFEGKIQKTEVVYKKLGWEAHALVAKEGLAILNGTQFMSAYGALVTNKAFELFKWANLIGAISLEAFDGKLEPMHPLVHKLRNQNGQIIAAEQIRSILSGSDNESRAKKYTQDPYSFRCMPQVHGASYDAFKYSEDIFSRELNGVNDNPNFCPEDNIILSGGNFHGQPLALALDFIAIAIAELGSISERRTFQLLSGQRELPDFLIDEPGLHSGLMIPQYVAAGIVSQNKQLCTPASVDSISSSNGQEDHVSMGANAATKALRVLENSQRVLAIELINASQAFNFRKNYKSSTLVQMVLSDFRAEIPILKEDRYLHKDIKKAIEFLKSYPIDEIV